MRLDFVGQGVDKNPFDCIVAKGSPSVRHNDRATVLASLHFDRASIAQRALVAIYSRLNNVIFGNSTINEERYPASTAVSNSFISFSNSFA